MAAAGKKIMEKALVLVILFVATLLILLIIYGNKSNTYTATIMPGPSPKYGCPAIFYSSNSTITSHSGFSLSNVSGLSDYVISQGRTGTIEYTVDTGKTLNPGINVTGMNVTNWVTFSHTNDTDQISNSHAGINVSIAPASEPFAFNSSYQVTDTLDVLANATTGTYWVSLSPGPCHGSSLFLITIGNAKYNGTLALPVYS